MTRPWRSPRWRDAAALANAPRGPDDGDDGVPEPSGVQRTRPLAAADRPRIAAFALVAEARLKQANKTDDGKLAWTQDVDELRQLVGQAKHALRDKTMDRAKEELADFARARGRLSTVRIKESGRRRLQAEYDAGTRVPWPKAEQSA